MTKEQLITELWAYKGGSKSISDVLKAIDAYASTAKPNVSGELGNDEKLANEFIWRDYLYIYLILFYALFWMICALFNL